MKKFGGLANIAVVVLMVLVLLTAIGCDEGMNMAGEVIGSTDPVDPTMNGEVKQPDPTMNDGSTDPVPPSIHPSLVEEPVTQEYRNGVAAVDFLPPSAWVLDFPGPYKKHTPPESSPEDFVGRVCMSANDDWAADDYIAPVQNAVVTITHGPRAGEQVTTDEGGYYLFPNVAGDKLYLRVERAYLEPKEVIAYRSSPTELQELRPNEVFNVQHQNREGLDNVPGMILVGLRWPDALRYILEDESLPHSLEYSMGFQPDRAKLKGSGAYGRHGIVIINVPGDEGRISYSVLSHEIAHARQHAVAIMHGGSTTSDWKDTPEGKAYAVAWEKDLEEYPDELYIIDDSDYFRTSILENAAQFLAYYWRLPTTGSDVFRDGDIVKGMRKRAPNRFRWAETYVNTQYN